MRWLSVMSLAKFARSNVDHQLSPNGRSGRDREAGAVAMIVAMLFGFGVLLGLGALVIDTGSLLYERRQLQNGADAAAMAVGKDCAGNAACAPDKFALSPSSLTVLAGANASDTLTTIESICGNLLARTANPGLTETCPLASTGQLVDCPPVPSTFVAAPYIEVRTATKTGNTSNPSILPPILAQTLVGGGYVGETVRACARVAWLPAGQPTGPVLPIAFSACSWADATGFKPGLLPPAGTGVAAHYEVPPMPGVYPGYGTSAEVAAYAAAHPPPAPQLSLWPSTEVKLYNQGQDAPGSCTTWNNHVAPGTFGELPQTGCNAIIPVNNWVQGDPSTNGNSTPCDTSILGKLKGHVVNVPIFDCYTPAQFNWADPPTPMPTCNYDKVGSWYHISGYAAFYLTGFYFSSGASDGYSIFPPDGANYQPCWKEGDRCISGWFTTGSLSATPAKTDEMSFGTFTPLFAG